MVMEQQSSNTEIKTLPFRTISEVTDESIKYIDDRRKHIITPLKTRWGKFNKVCCGGIEPNMIFTVAGGSGSGNIEIFAVYIRDYIENYRTNSVKTAKLIPSKS